MGHLNISDRRGKGEPTALEADRGPGESFQAGDIQASDQGDLSSGTISPFVANLAEKARRWRSAVSETSAQPARVAGRAGACRGPEDSGERRSRAGRA